MTDKVWPPQPEEFKPRKDTYEDLPPAFVDAAFYRDGQLVHSTLRQEEPQAEEELPGWTVQGARRG